MISPAAAAAFYTDFSPLVCMRFAAEHRLSVGQTVGRAVGYAAGLAIGEHG